MMRVYGSSELVSDVIQRDLCIGCGACMSLCPYFRSHHGTTVMLFPCTQQNGRCHAYCPKVEVDLDEVSQALFGCPYPDSALGVVRSIKTARAGDKIARDLVQAGGTVSSLMVYALTTGAIDAAILTDRKGLLPVPRIVTAPGDVLKYAASKYTASPTLSAFNQALKDGYRRIGVVATPCQSLALAQMRLNPTQIENFHDPTAIVVGLFCTWALDYQAIERFLAERVAIDTIRKLDIPPPPAEILDVYTREGKISFPLAEIRKLVPNTCAYCFDMTAEFADVAVGVLEGRPDTNTLIVRTERGEKLVEGAVREGYLIVKDMPKANLEHLREAAANKKRRALKKALDEGMINTASEGKRAYLRLNPEAVAIIARETGGVA